jgi:hypothetical protein
VRAPWRVRMCTPRGGSPERGASRTERTRRWVGPTERTPRSLGPAAPPTAAGHGHLRCASHGDLCMPALGGLHPVDAPAGHDGVDVHRRDRYRRPDRRAQPGGDPPVELPRDVAHGLLRRQIRDGGGQSLDLAAQLQRRRQQRFGGQTLTAQVALDPPVLVVWPVEAGERLALARQVIEVAALLGQPDLPFDHRLVPGRVPIAEPAPAACLPHVSQFALSRRSPAGQRASSRGCRGSQVLPSAASRRRRAIPDSTSSTTRFARNAVMSAES